MFTLLYGNQPALVKARLERLIKDRQALNASVERIELDARDITLQEIAQMIMQVSLTSEPRFIVVDHCYFLMKKKPKEKIEKMQNYEDFIHLVPKIPHETEVIFLVYTNEIENKSALIHHLETLGQTTLIPDIDSKQWPDFIKRYFDAKGMTLAYDANLELAKRVNEDVQLFFMYAEKLQLLGLKNLTLPNILENIPRSLEENIFELTNALVKQEIGKAIQIFQDLRIRNEEPVLLIQLLSKHFRLMQQVFYLSQQGDDGFSISKQLKIHEYRIKLMLQQKRTYSLKRLEKIQDALFQLDLQIKQSKVDRWVGFELFLLNFNGLIS